MDMCAWIYVVGSFVIGVLLRHWVNGKRWEFGDLRTVVAMLVEEAEQTMPGETGEEKLEWVLERCDKIGLTKWIPEGVLSAMIESAVYRLKLRPQVLPNPDGEITGLK